jgi:hypothetical protein
MVTDLIPPCRRMPTDGRVVDTSVSDGVDSYFEACRAVFGDRSETHRISLYISHADRDRDSPVHLYRLANACLDGGSLELWHRGVSLALTRPHDTSRSLRERWEARLRLGEWGDWQDLGWRIDYPPPCVDASSIPGAYNQWEKLEDLGDKTLLVSDMWDFGDIIWWLRYIEALRERFPGKILWQARFELIEFLRYNVRHLACVDVIDATSTGVRCDRYLDAIKLPAVIGTMPPFSQRSAPAPFVPLLRTERARIGFAFACNSEALNHLDRSVPLSVLAPLFWRPDIEWYSLQVGPRAEDASYYPTVRRPDPPLQSFSDTANLIAGLDGVITVDTSVAHLAGSLGVPTLTMLRFPADARWGLGDTTPLYPSMRLIRQRNPGNWMSVEAQVREALDSRWCVRDDSRQNASRVPEPTPE